MEKITTMIEFFVAFLIIGFVTAVLIALKVSLSDQNNKNLVDISEAIQQCEAELPRHLHCDYRIEAFVVEGKDAL